MFNLDYFTCFILFLFLVQKSLLSQFQEECLTKDVPFYQREVKDGAQFVGHLL